MRIINEYVLHCSASDRPEDDDISVIRQWHLERGFSDVGYWCFVKKDGTEQPGRRIEQPGAHVEGHNSDTVGICLSGNKQFTGKQFITLINVIKKLNALMESYFPGKPLPKIKGHCDYTDKKTCPNFNYKQFIKDNFPNQL